MEFYTNADEVWYSTPEGMEPLREGSPVIPYIIERVRDMYPRAYEALCECYKKSRPNVSYFNFLCARRFCKCNFGTLDHTREDVAGEIFNFEVVNCPLRGECPHECVICQPQRETKLTDAEKRVMRLVCDGLNNMEIADRLYLSPNTVKRHVAAAYFKVQVRNRAEFVLYANRNNLFNQ